MLHSSVQASTANALPWSTLGIPDRIAIVIDRVRLVAGEDRATLQDFQREPETCDLTEEELRANIGRASILVVTGGAQAAYDREQRVLKGANLVLGLMPDAPRILLVLREAGFNTREVGTLWDEIVNRAADDFAAHRAPHRSTPDIGQSARDFLSTNAN